MNDLNKHLARATTILGALSLCVLTVNTASAQSGTYGTSGSTTVTQPEKPTSTVGRVIDDTVVTAKVKSALLADPDVKSFDFKVETNKGEVQLSGFSDSKEQIDRAVNIAKGVEGVTNVINKVSLKTGDDTIGTKVDDSVVTAKVKSALMSDPGVKSSDIKVVTRKGEVQLSGFVGNETQIERAAEVARTVDGVHNVVNELTLKK